ncbi:MAG: hypothetical protein AAGF25_05080 [Pseudomonadota bacterium]
MSALKRLNRTMIAATIAVTALGSTASFQEVSAHEPYFREAPSAECHDEKLLKRIMKRFRIQAREVHHNESLEIIGIHEIEQSRYLPQDVHKSRPIARRYCQGHVHLSDGKQRTIWFLVEGGTGFASYSDNVEFCISGMDRWNVYNSACRVLR